MSKRCIRLPYPSDLSNREWDLINPHLPTLRSTRGRKRVHSYREILKPQKLQESVGMMLARKLKGENVTFWWIQ